MSNGRGLTRRDFARWMASGVCFAGHFSRGFADAIPAGLIRFVNAAPGNGLNFVLRNGAFGRKYQVETLPGGLGVIDFDNDGWPDLYCINGAALPTLQKSDPSFQNRLYRNNRNGTFTDVTARAGVQGRGYEMGVAVGDYNNDGQEDLYVVGVHGNTLYRNNGDGTFTDVTAVAGVGGTDAKGHRLWSVSAAWIDYDNDGRLDLFVSNYCDWEPGIDPICGGLTKDSRTYCHPDIYRSEPMLLYHNNGDGTFTEISRASGLGDILGKGMGVALADFDGSGRPGLFIANDHAPNLLIRNIGGGKMRETGIEAGVAYNGDGREISGMGADFGDIDGDGRPDIVMTGLRGETFELFANHGDGTFEDASAKSGILGLSGNVSGWGCGLVDLDNDGWLDMFVASGGLDTDEPQANRVFRNQRGRFTDVSSTAGADFSIAGLHRGAAFADFDNDGRIDVAVTSLNAPLELWMNRSPERHWLQLKLHGTQSNRSAIGTRVICRSSRRTQTKTVTNSVGYASSSDLRIHFGLDADRMVSVEILWPSGVTQQLSDLHADQRVDVTEPAGKAALDKSPGPSVKR
ncbi:MAG TPA: CRTAC1 family protein [Terracidiphilus sp.]|jgi:hypothetical protein